MPIPLKFKAALDDSAFMAGIRRIKTAGSKLAGGAGLTGKGGSLRGVGGMLGGAAALGATRSILQQGDALYNLSRKTGMTTTSLAALREMGAGANVEMEQLAKSVVKMQAAMETQKGAETIESLGLSVAKLKEMKPEVQFATIGEAIGKIADQSKKVGAAQGIFGKSGSDLFELFDDIGTMDMSKVSKNAKLFGDSAKDLADASDNLAAMKLGAIAKGSYIMNEVIKGGKGMFSDMRGFFGGKSAAGPAGPLISPVMKHGSPFDSFTTANKGGTMLDNPITEIRKELTAMREILEDWDQ